MAAENKERTTRPALIGLIIIYAILTHSFIVLPAEAQIMELNGNRTTIRAVIPDDVPPTYFQDPKTHKAAGFAVDVMEEIAKQSGLSVTYLFEKDWQAIIAALKSGRADIAPVLGMSEERNKILAFTTPVETVPVSLFVRSDNAAIGELKTGLTVGVIQGSAAYDAIKKSYSSAIMLKSYEHFSEGLLDLLAGQIDIFCCPATTLKLLARDAGVEDRIKIVGAPLMELKRGMAMRKDDAELFFKLNAATEAFVRSPEYQRIYAKWFGKPRPFLVVSKKMLLSASMIFLAVGGMVLWRYVSVASLNRKLQQEVSERTRVEDTLREKNTMLRTLIHAIPDQIFFKDSVGRYLLVNKAMEDTLGIGQEAFVGKTDDDISPPDVAEKCKRSDAEAIKKGGPVWSDESYTDKNGEMRFLEVVKAPIQDHKGGLKGLVVVSRDITDRRQAEDALRESEEKFSKSFQKAPLLITLSDVETGRLLEVNEKFLEVSGFARDEVIGRTVIEFGWNSEEQRSRMRQSFLEHDRVAGMELILRRKDGRVINCLYNGEAITVSGKPRLLSIAQDITERKLAENSLRESEDRFRSIFEQATDGFMIADAETRRLIEANKAICAMLEYTHDELLGLSIEALHPEKDLFAVRNLFDKQVRGEISLAPNVPMLRKDGSVFYADINAKRVTLGGKQCLAGIFRDITERKKAEELIHRSLREKEVLLKEVHHRVKNNMQVIYSLLNLQAKGITDKTVRAMFEESRDRVSSMALIHEKLYKSDDLAHIDFREYLRSLISSVATTYKRHDVRVSVDMEPLVLDVNVGIPCGLIVNELVSNSLKYAFPEERTGTIQLGISKNSDGKHVLTVADNGIGFPPGVDFRNTRSLGLKLVNVLAGQIRGTIELSNKEGARFDITFPGNSDYKENNNG